MADSCVKNTRIFSIIVSKLELCDVQMQIFLADLMERPDNAALQDRPEALDCIGMNRADNMLSDAVIDRLMVEAVLQPQIARISVSAEKADAVRYGFADESLKCVPIRPLDHASNDITLALDCANNRSLASVATAPRSASLIPMPVLVASADVGFVNLNNSAELLNVLDHGGSDLVAHKPSGLVAAEAHVPVDLEGAHALLADQHQMGDSVPIFQRLIRVLEDCPGQVRETIALVRASIALPVESHRRDGIDSLRATTRTTDALRPSASDQVPDAIVLRLEQRIELRCGQLVDGFRMFCAGHVGNLFDCEATLA